MVALNEFIQIHPENIDGDKCEYLIQLFEQNPEYLEEGDDETYSVFNLTQIKDLTTEVKELHNDLIRKVFEYRDLYYEFFDKRVFPEKHAFEVFKIERYLPSEEDEIFKTNVDVLDYSSARRFLCFTWFLNDNSSGQYEFLDERIQPEEGKLLIYPPLWMFPYKRYEPIKEPQYILRTYLHYK